MVKRYLPSGGYYFEPPFTPEEEDEFYRNFGGAPKATLRGSRPQRPAGDKPQAAQPQRPPVKPRHQT